MHERIHKYQQSITTFINDLMHYLKHLIIVVKLKNMDMIKYANLECFPVLLFECLLLQYYKHPLFNMISTIKFVWDIKCTRCYGNKTDTKLKQN